MLTLTATLIAALITVSLAAPDRKARQRPVATHAKAVSAPRPDPPACPGSNRAIDYYRHAVRDTLEQIGDYELPARRWWGCESARRRAAEWRDKARVARQALEDYMDRMYDWTAWLPDKYARVGACETGYGQRPGNWQHDSGTYVSAFGIIRGAYDQFSHRLGYPGWDEGGRTPRQQYEVAAAIQAAYGWSAWGCGGA